MSITMSYWCLVFEQDDEMLTLLSMEKQMVECNQNQSPFHHLSTSHSFTTYQPITFSPPVIGFRNGLGDLEFVELFSKFDIIAHTPVINYVYQSHLSSIEIPAPVLALPA